MTTVLLILHRTDISLYTIEEKIDNVLTDLEIAVFKLTKLFCLLLMIINCICIIIMINAFFCLQEGYVKLNSGIKIQTCPGNPDEYDLGRL